jgi:adenosylhomocysteinase
MSNSFTNQSLAQSIYGKMITKLMYTGCPKKLDEEVARLHLEQLGVKLTQLTDEQARYIGIQKKALQTGTLQVLIVNKSY